MDLLYAVLGPYLDRVSFTGPNVDLEPDPIFNLSAALHELAANAIKHGSLSRPKGQLTLSWNRQPHAARRDAESSTGSKKTVHRRAGRGVSASVRGLSAWSSSASSPARWNGRFPAAG